jgi:hypothetical protein
MLLKTFDDIAELDDSLFAVWMERVDPKTLCIALHGASEALRERIVGGLSRFAKKLLDQEMSLIARLSHDVIAQAQQDLLELALSINEGEEITPRRQERGRNRSVGEPVKIDLTSQDRLIDTLVRLAEKAQKHGLLALEEDLESIEDPLFRDGLEYVIAGVDSDFVKDVIQTRLTYLEEEHRRWARRKSARVREELNRSIREQKAKMRNEVLRGEMIVEALLSIREGENPLLLRERLQAFSPEFWRRRAPAPQTKKPHHREETSL